MRGPENRANTGGHDRGIHAAGTSPRAAKRVACGGGAASELDKSRPTRPCGGPRMNPSLDDGNPPRPFRHLRVAEHCTPDQIFESSSRSFGVGSKIGYHHHQPCRPTFKLDARGKAAALARGHGKKVGTRLARQFRAGEPADQQSAWHAVRSPMAAGCECGQVSRRREPDTELFGPGA